MGRIILISGPSFGGKTHLVSRLIADIVDLKVIYFEKHFNKKNITISYENYYSDIEAYNKSGYNVICESVYSPSTCPIIKKDFLDSIDIVCLPDIALHIGNYRKFLRIHGWETVKKRTGGFSVGAMRDNYLKHTPPKHTLYNGKNYNSILDKIRGEICGL